MLDYTTTTKRRRTTMNKSLKKQEEDIERKRYRSTIRRMRDERFGREWGGDDEDGREYGLRKKARRIGSFWKVDETEISP